MKNKKFKIGDRVKVISHILGAPDKRVMGKNATVILKGVFGDFEYGIEFDENVNGHSCAEHGKDGCCYYAYENNLELIAPKNNKKIVITSDGVETLARLYEGNKVVKSATAKCSPHDEYNFEAGAKIAFDRLTGNEEKPKYKAGDKVKVIANTCYHGYKIGSIVTLRDYHEKYNLPWDVKEGNTFIRECDFEPYTEPEYFTGKVVCVKSTSSGLTVGKVYDFAENEGRGRDNNGGCIIGTPSKDIDDINFKLCDCYQFIPFVE